LAHPGEFSKRAFLNGKIDLTKAEAIADLINATSEQAARSAIRSLQGEFSRRIYKLKEFLISLRIEIEAELDFPEEELDLKTRHKQINTALEILNAIDDIKKTAKQSILLNEGINLVIIGQPNVGKSSLFNVLTGEDTAIVTNIPGTTRDVLHADINIDSLPIHVIDTAGLQDSEDLIEQEGIRRARNEINTADHILFLVDASHNLERKARIIISIFAELPNMQGKTTIVFNKIDLTNELPRIEKNSNVNCIYISAKAGRGIDLLKQHLKNVAGFSQTDGDFSFSARRRHLDALDRAAKKIHVAHDNLVKNIDLALIAEDLRTAQDALSEITGEFLPNDLLDRIFSEFCIGK
jgi:tRNA modification GTPase